MSQYFPKSYEPFSGNSNVKVDLSNYATKADMKNISLVDTSRFALKTNLANLKSNVDKLDIDKLKPVPADFSKLRDVVKDDVVKKTDYNKLVTKVDNIDTSGLVKQTYYKTKITEIEGKIPSISTLATIAALATVENKIPDTSNLKTKTALTTVENKIPDKSNLATKTAIITVENKIPDTNNLETKTALTIVENKIPDISSLVSKSDHNTKITEVENKVNKLETFDFSYFRGKNYFDEDGTQNYLIFQPIYRYFKLNSVVNATDRVLPWQFKGLSNESIKPFRTFDNSLKPSLSYYSESRIRVKFARNCL